MFFCVVYKCELSSDNVRLLSLRASAAALAWQSARRRHYQLQKCWLTAERTDCHTSDIGHWFAMTARELILADSSRCPCLYNEPVVYSKTKRGNTMKTLRIALSLLACVVLCLCFAPAGYAEDVAVSEVVAFNARGVYVNEDNFPDEHFRNYIIQKYGTYLSSGEIAAATVIDCSKSYSISYDNIDIDNPDEETPADTPGDLIFYIPDNTDGNQEYPSTESDNDEVITPYPQSGQHCFLCCRFFFRL